MSDNNSSGILGRSLRAGKWYFFNIFFQKIFQIISFFILARILSPSDFGIISLMIVVPTLLDSITGVSFEDNLIFQRSNPQKYLNAVWSFNIIRSVGIFFITLIIAAPVARFLNIENAINAIRIAGIMLLIQSLSSTGQFYLFRDLEHKKIFARDLSGQMAYMVFSITIALVYHSYWALFIGMIAQQLASTITTYLIHPERPKFTAQLGILSDLINYTKWIYGQNIIGQIGNSLESIIMGKFVGAEGLGLYGKAKSLAILPTSPVASIVAKIGFPTFSHIRDSREKIIDGINKSINLLLIFIIPFTLAIIVAGHNLVFIILGEKWLPIILPLKILVVSMSINMLVFSVSEPILNGIGKPKYQFILRTTSTVIFLLGAIIVVPMYGIVGASIAVLVSSICLVFMLIIMTPKNLYGDQAIETGKSFITILGITFISFIFTYPLLMFPIFNTTYGFIVLSICGAILYTAGIYIYSIKGSSGLSKTINLVSSTFLKKTHEN